VQSIIAWCLSQARTNLQGCSRKSIQCQKWCQWCTG